MRYAAHSQHIHGTDNSRCLISLALMCGQIGRPGAGLHPLRGQNNVQGASDAGLIPMFLPDYASVLSDDVRAKYAALTAHGAGLLVALTLGCWHISRVLSPNDEHLYLIS